MKYQRMMKGRAPGCISQEHRKHFQISKPWLLDIPGATYWRAFILYYLYCFNFKLDFLVIEKKREALSIDWIFMLYIVYTLSQDLCPTFEGQNSSMFRNSFFSSLNMFGCAPLNSRLTTLKQPRSSGTNLLILGIITADTHAGLVFLA